MCWVPQMKVQSTGEAEATNKDRVTQTRSQKYMASHKPPKIAGEARAQS